jgi:hypothetical protein
MEGSAMVKQDSSIRFEEAMRRNSRFSLTTLLGVLTLCGVLLAWYVDHCQLKEQIPSPPRLEMMTYRLSHASAESAGRKLNEVFESDTVVCETVSNSIIVGAERKVHDQIQLMLLHIDRKDTEYVDAVPHVSLRENDIILSEVK